MASNDKFILEILERHQLIDGDLAEKAYEVAVEHESTALEVLYENEILTAEDVNACLAEEFGLEQFNLREATIPSDVLDAIPVSEIRKYKVLPVGRDNGTLIVAIGDPMNLDVVDDLRIIVGSEVRAVVANPQDIEDRSQAMFKSASMLDAHEIMTSATIDVRSLDTGEFGGEDEVDDDDAPIIKLVQLIIVEACRKRASDIHIEPEEKTLRVRYRIDGVLHEVEAPPKRLQSAVITRIKIESDMKIAEKRKPQDGRIKTNVLGKPIDLRVSSIPSTHGESIVMRILDKEALNLGLPQLGFLSDDQAIWEKCISLADGIVLVTGPTGSGKTTTLYACLNEINKPDRKIITVEDPIEYQLDGVNQVGVRSDIGLTFSAALRAMLRQAPNIVMLGEIRDQETAEIAINASLTGHLVFSTLHTNDAPGAISRLIDMNVKPFLVASSIRAILAQRLVRAICKDCKVEYEPSERDIMLLGSAADSVAGATLYKGAGCANCSNTGYRGRKGIFEILLINDELRGMIFKNCTSAEYRKVGRENGMRSLREDGLRKALSGMTTLDEVFRVTMGDA